MFLLHSMLDELERWTSSSGSDLPDEVRRTLPDMPRRLPVRQTFAGFPVLTHFRSLVFMRKLRESWDDLIRRFEDSWDSQECVKRRAMLVAMAANHLAAAATPFEVREARRHDDLADMQSMFQHVAAALDNLWEPCHGKDPSQG